MEKRKVATARTTTTETNAKVVNFETVATHLKWKSPIMFFHNNVMGKFQAIIVQLFFAQSIEY